MPAVAGRIPLLQLHSTRIRFHVLYVTSIFSQTSTMLVTRQRSEHITFILLVEIQKVCTTSWNNLTKCSFFFFFFQTTTDSTFQQIYCSFCPIWHIKPTSYTTFEVERASLGNKLLNQQITKLYFYSKQNYLQTSYYFSTNNTTSSNNRHRFDHDEYKRYKRPQITYNWMSYADKKSECCCHLYYIFPSTGNHNSDAGSSNGKMFNNVQFYPRNFNFSNFSMFG